MEQTKQVKQKSPKILIAQAKPTEGYSFFNSKGKTIPPIDPPVVAAELNVALFLSK